MTDKIYGRNKDCLAGNYAFIKLNTTPTGNREDSDIYYILAIKLMLVMHVKSILHGRRL